MSASQKQVTGKPKPVVLVDCAVTTTGSKQTASCVAQGFLATGSPESGSAARAEVAERPADDQAREAKEPRRHRAVLVLKLNAVGKRLLRQSTTGTLAVQVNTTVTIPSRRPILRQLLVLLRR